MLNIDRKESRTSTMKMSRIEDHNIDKETDRLYDPLRNAILNPETVTEHSLRSPKAASKSLIHDRF
jgi:hypothetical protein